MSSNFFPISLESCLFINSRQFVNTGRLFQGVLRVFMGCDENLKILSFATWMELEDHPSERNLSQKDTYCMMSFIRNLKRVHVTAVS
jgi:hypothetical protein